MDELIQKPEKQHSLVFINKMLWTGIAMVILAKFFFGWFANNYSIAIDTIPERCIPEYSTYFVNKNVKDIKRGHIYMFSSKGLTPFYKDGTQIGKYAIAIEGDNVVQNEQGVFVNGKKMLDGYAVVDKLKRPKSDFYKEFKVPKNQIFFAGSAPRSYDSRYWGTASIDQVIGEAQPLW